MLRTDLPQFDISENIIIGTDITEEILAFYKQPFRLKAGIFVLCLEREIHASIKMTDYYIKKNDFVSILPGNILQFIGQQGKVRLCFVAFSSEFLSQTNMVKFSADFLPQVIENPVISLKQESAELLAEYFSLLVKTQEQITEIFNTEITKSILQSMLQGIGYMYQKHTLNPPALTRKEEIRKQFVGLVMQHYTRERSISFYAEQLNITPQHLCTTIKQITGFTASDIIARMVILDAKAQLKSTELTIQEISYSLNFPNVSFFGKYFKRHVGMSPQAYRNSQ